MSSFNVDVEFFQKHTQDRGLVLLEAATKHNPRMLMEILEAGWGESTCAENPVVGRKFLTQLKNIASPEDARNALRLYFRVAPPEVVTRQVMGSSASDSNSSPLLDWMESANKRPLRQALLDEARSLGADLESVFTHSVYDPALSKSKSSDHTVLSVLVAHGTVFQDGKLPEFRMDQVMDIMNAGKSFDKSTAANLLRLPHKQGLAWIHFFLENGLAKPSQMLEFTARMTTADPDRKALLGSMAAMQAIDELLLPLQAPGP